VIPLIKNLIQLAVVPEVNGAGTMFSGCGLWVTLIYLPITRSIGLKYNTIIDIYGRRLGCRGGHTPDGDTLLYPRLHLSRDGTMGVQVVED